MKLSGTNPTDLIHKINKKKNEAKKIEKKIHKNKNHVYSKNPFFVNYNLLKNSIQLFFVFLSYVILRKTMMT